MRTQDSKMMVPAFLINDQPRSHMLRSKSTKRGRRYSGSSMTNGVSSPWKGLVFLSMMPETMIEAMPTKYAKVAIMPLPSKNAPANKAMMGSLAEQGMKVVVMIVMRRALSDSMVRVDITAGMPQPVPMSMGMKVLPDRPKRRKMRSKIKATRDM